MVKEKTPSVDGKTIKAKKTALKTENEVVVPKAKKVSTKPSPKATTASLEVFVFNLKGEAEKTLELNKELFQTEESPRLLAQYVRVYLANQRSGTASTKRRGEVVGTTKKVYRQKGTGNARHGSTKAPIFVGGGVDSGPKPTDHSLKLNKKQKRKALLCALSMKAREQGIAVLGQDIVTMVPKTRALINVFETAKLHNRKTIIVQDKVSNGITLSARNLEGVYVVTTSNLNAYTVLMNEKVLFTEDALTSLSNLYLNK